MVSLLSSLSVFFLLSLPVPLRSTEFYREIQFRDNIQGQVSRQYYLDVPSADSLRTPLSGKRALLVLFHGLTNDCDSFRKYSGFQEFSSEAGIYLATPCSKKGYLGRNAWNAGRCCVNFDKHDDVQFFEEVVKSTLDYLSSEGLPSVEEVWVAGFSNGGFLAEAIACQKSFMLDKLVSMAGNTVLGSGNDGAFDICDNLWSASREPVSGEEKSMEELMDDSFSGDASSPRSSLPHSEGVEKLKASFPHTSGGEFTAMSKVLSSLHIHTTGDPVVPFNGDYLIRRFPSKQRDMERWASRVGCSSSYTSSDVAQSWTLREYCASSAPVSVNLLLQQGGGHGMERLYGQHALAFLTGDARFLDEGHSELN